MNLTGSKKTLALAGVICGLVAACLAYFGNPANMAFCIACFIRDTAGAMGMHQAEAVMYARPEIIGLVLGAFIISIVTKEFRSTGGSSPMIRFILGVIIMIGALVFLGCPLRMVLRMSAGDLNAWVALIGFILGVATGVFALKQGFSLGRAPGNNKSKWSSTSGYRCWNFDSCNMHITFESKCGWSGKFTRTNHYVSCRRPDLRSYGSEIKNVLCRWNP